jgi:hypothetical protein
MGVMLQSLRVELVTQWIGFGVGHADLRFRFGSLYAATSTDTLPCPDLRKMRSRYLVTVVGADSKQSSQPAIPHRW